MAKTVQFRPKASARYKYNIDLFVGGLPRSIKTHDLLRSLAEAGIPEHAYYRHRRIPLTSSKCISELALRTYMALFDCRIEEFCNQSINAKPIVTKVFPKRKTKL